MNFCLFMDTQPKNVSGRTALFSALTALLAKLFYDIAGLGFLHGNSLESCTVPGTAKLLYKCRLLHSGVECSRLVAFFLSL